MNDDGLVRSATREIDKKLDDLVEKVTRIDERLSRQPLIDKAKEENVAQQFTNVSQHFEEHNRRITGLETNQKWVVLAVLGVVINAIVQLLFK